MNHTKLSPQTTPSRDLLAIHVMKRLTIAQTQERLLTLQDLAEDLGVRRADVRRTVSALHQEGFVDALRLRLTLAGFALGSSLVDALLAPLRRPAIAAPLAKAA